MVRAVRSIGIVQQVCEVFENETRYNSDQHPYPGLSKDYHLLVVLQEAKVFAVHPEISHSSFHMTKRLMASFDLWSG